MRGMLQPSVPCTSASSLCSHMLRASRQLALKRTHRCFSQPASRAAYHAPGSNGTPTSQSLDAIMVLGGGYNMDGTLPPWVHRRLDLAHDLYQQSSSKARIVCLGEWMMATHSYELTELPARHSSTADGSPGSSSTPMFHSRPLNGPMCR
jgi:hypothetical protein